MYFYPYSLYMNPYYLLGTVFVVIAVVIGLIAQTRVSSAFRKYSHIHARIGKTGADVAREILDANGMADMPVNLTHGTLTDNFNPGNGSVNLSDDIYNGTSLASLAVAAHECGHAIQYHTGYTPIKVRNLIAPVCNIGNYLGWIAIVIGLALGRTKIAWFGFVLMLGILVFQLVTLPVEFDASRRGLAILESHYLMSDEIGGAKAMLKAAAMTYIAATLQTLASMLRIFLLIAGNSRDD